MNQWRLAALMLGLVSTPGCVTVLVPPAAHRLQDPVAVYVLDHGRTPSLVLPDGRGGGMTRYAYGDWNWYALEKRRLLDGIAALFLPTRGAVGRKDLPGPPTPAGVREQVPIPIDHLHVLLVEREAALRLRTRLDRIFEQNQQTLVFNEADGLEFVHHPRRYCALSNSNHALADWLREIGVRVRGPAAFSRWAVVECD
jgi:hypothetical protein